MMIKNINLPQVLSIVYKILYVLEELHCWHYALLHEIQFEVMFEHF